MTFDRETGVYEALRKELRKFTPLPVHEARRRGESFTLGGAGSGVPTVSVAASDASDLSKSKADYVCTGTGDEATIEEAMADIPSGGGRILHSEGKFSIAADITLPVSKITFDGLGYSTVFEATASMASMIVANSDANDVFAHIKNMKFDGKGLATICVDAPGNQCTVERVEATDATGVGIRVGDSTNAPAAAIDCFSHDNGSHGIEADIDGEGTVWLLNNTCKSNTGDGIKFFAVIGTGGGMAVGNKVHLNTGFGILVDESGANSDVILTQNVTRTNTAGEISGGKAFHNIINLVYTPGDHDLSGVSQIGLSTADFSDQRTTLTTGTGSQKWVAPVALTINDVVLAVATSPTGAALIVDVNKNGTTIFTTQANRPTVPDGDADGVGSPAVPDVTTMTAGEYLTVDIDQIGSTVAGGELTVVVEWQPT